MQRIGREHYTYSFDKDAPAIAEIETGDRLTLETHDSSTGRIKRREDLDYYLSVRKTRESNPACGPVTVRGAMPGDGLNVRIERIQLVPPGILRFTPGFGILNDAAEAPAIVMVDVDGDTLALDNGIRLPARPMVGVVGTALPDRVVYTADPDVNGSNMDCNSIAEGTVVHLPVWVPGRAIRFGRRARRHGRRRIHRRRNRNLRRRHGADRRRKECRLAESLVGNRCFVDHLRPRCNAGDCYP